MKISPGPLGLHGLHSSRALSSQRDQDCRQAPGKVRRKHFRVCHIFKKIKVYCMFLNILRVLDGTSSGRQTGTTSITRRAADTSTGRPGCSWDWWSCPPSRRTRYGKMSIILINIYIVHLFFPDRHPHSRLYVLWPPPLRALEPRPTQAVPQVGKEAGIRVQARIIF